MGRLDGKIGVITGAGSGIGRSAALAFAAEGATVVVGDIDEKGGRETADLIGKDGGKARFHRTDVSNSSDVQALIAAAEEGFGRLDYLINNAGIDGDRARTADCTEENWQQVLAVNLTGVFLGMKHGIPALLRAGGGAIVNTGSGAGLVGLARQPAYCASKAGVILLTRTAAIEYGRNNIRVNCVCPGPIETPMFEAMSEEFRQSFLPRIPLRRFGKPEEIAAAMLYLCSDESSFVTGVAFSVDGGILAG